MQSCKDEGRRRRIKRIIVKIRKRQGIRSGETRNKKGARGLGSYSRFGWNRECRPVFVLSPGSTKRNGEVFIRVVLLAWLFRLCPCCSHDVYPFYPSILRQNPFLATILYIFSYSDLSYTHESLIIIIQTFFYLSFCISGNVTYKIQLKMINLRLPNNLNFFSQSSRFFCL